MSSCLRTETPSVGSTPTRWVTIGSPGDGICPGTVGTGGPPVNRTDMLAVTLTSRSAQHRVQLQAAPHDDAREARHHAPLVSCNALLAGCVIPRRFLWDHGRPRPAMA